MSLPRASAIRAFEGLMAIREVHLQQDELVGQALAQLASLLSFKPEVKEPGAQPGRILPTGEL